MSASARDSSAGVPRPGRLTALGRSCARRPGRVVAAWLLALVASVAVSQLAGGAFNDNVELPGTQANAGLKLLEANDKDAGGHIGQVVFHVSTGSLRSEEAQIEQAVASLRQLPHVQGASDPLAKGSSTISVDGRTAYSSVHFNVRPKTLGDGYIAKLEAATSAPRAAGVQVEYGGGLDELFRPAPNDVLSEVIGFAVALIVLLVGFGSVAAAGLPLLTALLGVAVGLSLLTIAAAGLTFGTASPTLALMIGIGVGIDYALFLTTRHRQLLMDGADPVDAAAATVASSGHAVLVAAGTVSLALLGLFASGILFIGQLGLAAVFTVLVAGIAALTLVPALLGLLGRRIDALAVRTPVAESGADGDAWHSYASLVGRRPWRFLAAGVAILLLLSIPLLSIDLGHIDDGADPTSYTDRRAYDLIAQGFGVGANGAFTIVVDLTKAGEPPQQIAGSVESALHSTAGIAHASSLSPSENGKILVGSVVPSTSPQDGATASLFKQLIDTTVPDALKGSGAQGYVTGNLPTQLQFRDTVVNRLPVVIAVVVVLAFLLLMATFRSVLVALKAAILNLLSIGAAYGIVVAVFQWGWGGSFFGVAEHVPIESYVPVLMFAIVFGLSMDYEVFLLSHIKEGWDASGDNTSAVATGLASTARVITCAALIMASVFISFVLSSNVVIKMLAVGLSASVLVDATVVRLVLVPATMTLLGRANWWLPAWLERLLPRIEPEGGASVAAVQSSGAQPPAQPHPAGPPLERGSPAGS